MGYIYKHRIRRKSLCSSKSLGVIVLLGVIIALAFLHEKPHNPGYHPHQDKHHYPVRGESSHSDDTTTTTSPIWTRISDTIHVYSAHFDPRIRKITSSPLINLSLIRIIGIKRFPSPVTIRARNPSTWLRIKEETFFHDYECKLFLTQNSSTVQISSTFLTYHVIEEGIKTFAACFFNCYFNLLDQRQLSQTFSAFVALSPKNVGEYPNKLLRVEVEGNFPEKVPKKFENLKKLTSYSTSDLAICVRPLFSSPQDDFLLEGKLVQFISYYVAMGVRTFNFYELTIFSKVRAYLRKFVDYSHFRRENDDFPDSVSHIRFRVHLRKWNLPTGNTSELWDFGSLAALNDCLYRNMGADHVLFVDLDEFIVPGQNDGDEDTENGLRSLGGLINYLEKVGGSGGGGHFHDRGESNGLKKGQKWPPPAQIVFRNTFFCSEFCLESQNRQGHRHHETRNLSRNDPSTTSPPISTCTTRTKRVWSEKLRSKFVVRPASIISVGHHTSHNFWRRGRQVGIDPGTGHTPISITAHPRTALLNHYRDCGPISTKNHPIFNRLTMRDENILKILRNTDFQWFLP